MRKIKVQSKIPFWTVNTEQQVICLKNRMADKISFQTQYLSSKIFSNKILYLVFSLIGSPLSFNFNPFDFFSSYHSQF